MTLLDVLGELTSDEDRRAAGACFRSLSCHLAEGKGEPQAPQATEWALRMTKMFVRIKDKDYFYLSCQLPFWTASVDEHLQKLGAESFDRFQRCVFPKQSVTCSYTIAINRRVNNLDKEVTHYST